MTGGAIPPPKNKNENIIKSSTKEAEKMEKISCSLGMQLDDDCVCLYDGTEREKQRVNRGEDTVQAWPYVHTLSETVTNQRLGTTGRGILFQIPLNLGNHFVSSVKMDAKEHFRIILTP